MPKYIFQMALGKGKGSIRQRITGSLFSGDNHIGFSKEMLVEAAVKLILSVSGVLALIKTKGLNIPRTVVVDLPPRTELTISRMPSE